MNAQEALNYGLIDKVITTMSETTDDSKKKMIKRLISGKIQKRAPNRCVLLFLNFLEVM